MLSSLRFLIYGEVKEKQKEKFRELECLYLINKNQPIRDPNGNPLTADDLKSDLEQRLVQLELEPFKPVVFDILERLEIHDEALHYFVLVSTFRLPDKKFETSLKQISVDQELMTFINGEYKYRLYSEPNVQNNIPHLAWDISSVLKTLKVADKDQPMPPNNLENIEPVDDWGLLSSEFRGILENEELRLSARERGPVDFFHLDTPTFLRNVLDMHRGVSSDVFQTDGAGHFYQSKACRVAEWNLTTTRTVLRKHVYLANQTAEVVGLLKRHYVSGTDNSIRLMMQKYILDEQQLFAEYFEAILDPDSMENLRFRNVIRNLSSFDISSDRFSLCDEVYQVVSAYYHVLREMNRVIGSINDYSPIQLDEMSFVGSQSAPVEYSRRMWRRLNVALIRFIVNKMAEMLTTPDAELMELLTDAGDAKLIKDPSIWQRLNPLHMESSQCINEHLANRVADLIIGFRFFVNDKKQGAHYKTDGETFAKSDIQDAEELELFSKTPEFEGILSSILEPLDVNRTENNLGELTECIESLLEQIPTRLLVEKYSQVVLEKSVRFFEFLKKFFTSAYVHLNGTVIGKTLDILEQQRMHKRGYDEEFLKTIAYDKKSTMEDAILSVRPPEPLNVFVSRGVTDIYSQVFTVLNLLRTALDAVIDTHQSDTLRHEPRLRYAFFHMNTTVFAIRKNMLAQIEAAYEVLMKSVDFKSSPDSSRSAHEWLNVCYQAHRKFIRDIAGALMLNLKRGTTGRIVRLMVSSVVQASRACVSGDAVGADRSYQQFQTHLRIFLDQCRIDHVRYPLYKSLEMGDDETDGRRSLDSSYSDDLSCRSY